MCSSFHQNRCKNDTCKWNTEGFVPVSSLIKKNGVIGLLSLFIRSLIGSTGIIWYSVYINAKLIYASENLARTISECEIVCNVLYVTSTCPFIYWCSRYANVKWTPWVWHLSWNSIELNCVPASAKILSKSHHPNLSIFPNIYWNISNFSITSSVAVLSVP